MASTTQRELKIAARAGLFVSLGLALFGLIIVLIGQERRLFGTQVRFHAWFENVDGLKRDSPVWLGGLEVGRVSAISFSPDLGDKRINVQMEIAAKYAERVRSDSVARLASRGVLGDKAVDITIGTSEGQRVPPGGEIQSGSSGDLSSLLKASGQIIDNAVVISRDVRRAVEGITQPAVTENLASVAESLSSILGAVEKGDGALHALIYDKRTSADVKALIAHASETAVRVDRAVEQVDAILAQVRTGEGVAHALLYDPKGSKAISELGDAANELAGLVHDAKASPNGAVHQLVYGDARGMFADLGRAAADLRKITATIASGQGTLGALIQDPTVYDSLRTILGNVKRNRVLRSLVRYSISNGEDWEKVGQPEQKVAPPPSKK